MAGLLDNLANAPQETGVGNALMAAAAALLTPSVRGGGLGSAFAAMPQAIQQAQMQSMQNRLFGLKERGLNFEMDQARMKQEQEQAQRANLTGLVNTLPPEQRGLATALGTDYFKNMAPQTPKLETFYDDQGRERKGWATGPGSAPQFVGGAKSGGQSGLAQLLAERERYPEGSPQRRFYDAAISKSTTHAPPTTSITFGQPVQGIGPDGKLQYFQFPNRPGEAPIPTGIAPQPKPEGDASSALLKDASFADRMLNAEQQLKSLPPSAVPSRVTAGLASIPVIGGYLARDAETTEQQQYRTLADEWIRAKLRPESGAVIGKEEMEKEYEVYFPQPGDSTERIRQKEQLRQQAVESQQKKAGSTYKPNVVDPLKVQRWSDHGYKSADEAIRDGKNALMRNPSAKSEIIRRLEGMGINNHGLK